MTKPIKPKRTGNYKAGPGRTPLPPGQRKIPITFSFAPDLRDWIKAQPPGTAERILQKARIDSLIV